MGSRLWSIVLGANVGRSSHGREGEGGNELAGICPVDRTVVVLNELQRDEARERALGPHSLQTVIQPRDRGTAAALLLGLVSVLTTEPDAIVVVIPSHETVADREGLKRHIDDAVNYARNHFAAVLIGAGPASGRPNNQVVIVAQARALLHLCRQRLPAVSSIFVAALTMPHEARRRYLSARYPALPSRDLAEHVLMAPESPARSTWAPSILWWTDVASRQRPGVPSRTGVRPSPAPRVRTKRASIASGAAASILVN